MLLAGGVLNSGVCSIPQREKPSLVTTILPRSGGNRLHKKCMPKGPMTPYAPQILNSGVAPSTTGRAA